MSPLYLLPTYRDTPPCSRWKRLLLCSTAVFRQQYSRLSVTTFNSWVKVIKIGCLGKGQHKIILLVKNQSKYLAGQHFDRGRRLEYRLYRSTTPLHRFCLKPKIISTKFCWSKLSVCSICQTFVSYHIVKNWWLKSWWIWTVGSLAENFLVNLSSFTIQFNLHVFKCQSIDTHSHWRKSTHSIQWKPQALQHKG